jgi:hypothetical protein
MPQSKARLSFTIGLAASVLAPWPAWAASQASDAEIWSQVGGTPRSIAIGSYSFEIEERVVEDPGMQRWIPSIVPSSEAEAAAWLYRTINGAKVRYDEFLGSERIRFERSLAFRIGTEQLPHNEVDGIIGQIYDRNHNGRLSRRELERGNATMRRFFAARVRGLVAPGADFQPLPGLRDATAFASAWLDHEADLAALDPWHCPDCAGVPHLDKLAALVGYLQEYAPPMEGAHAEHFVPGYNQIFLTVDTHPDRSCTLRLDAADGRSYWDTGQLPHGGGALDGTLDLVTAPEEFTGASYNEVSARWERFEPGAGSQWMFEVLVDLAHAHLPRQLQVAGAMELEPDFEVPGWFTDGMDAEHPNEMMREVAGIIFEDAPPCTSSPCD